MGNYVSYYLHNQSQQEDSSIEVFMKGGACKEVFTAFQDCAKKAEKNNESIGIKCYPMMEKCMLAHSEYYYPILEAEKNATEVMIKDFLPSTAGRDLTEGKEDAEVEEEAKRILAVMEGGGCKEAFKAYLDCSDEAEKKKEETSAKCSQQMSKLVRCMHANPEHFQFIRAGEEQMRRELESL
ncbi:hypothetical protein Rs2_48760 [Raphanus sativus]|uniref:Uncharacterized protein LOC130504208 n=1 Tax=Raphanus sativus TaxID=3726 RepID=A0A9W3CTI5_RAPSA|nr:uncharacterized protein LOC130504208 [Raphanus sativus]KAJ4869671.1 hypothetical protein Rs2_48760 [Raphanus sativus]